MRRTSPPKVCGFYRHDRKTVIFIIMSIFLDSYEDSGLTCLTGRPGEEPRSRFGMWFFANALICFLGNNHIQVKILGAQ